jgi:hypothetical protein
LGKSTARKSQRGKYQEGTDGRHGDYNGEIGRNMSTSLKPTMTLEVSIKLS